MDRVSAILFLPTQHIRRVQRGLVSRSNFDALAVWRHAILLVHRIRLPSVLFAVHIASGLQALTETLAP